jgi:hypothetical protein
MSSEEGYVRAALAATIVAKAALTVKLSPNKTRLILISQMLQPTNRRDAIYRVSNRCAFSGFWSRRDKSRLYGAHFVGISNICLWLKHLANQEID